MRFLWIVLFCLPLRAAEIASGPFSGLSTKRIPDAASFEVRDGVGIFRVSSASARISDGYRSELGDMETPEVGATVRYQLRTRIPSHVSLDSRPGTIVIAQWHDAKVLGQPAQRPPLSVRIANGKLQVVLFNDDVWRASGMNGKGRLLASFPLQTDVWYSLDFVVRWSATEDGSIFARVNGRDLIHYTGAVGYLDDTVAPYFKFGVYTVHAPSSVLEIQHADYVRVDLSH